MFFNIQTEVEKIIANYQQLIKLLTFKTQLILPVHVYMNVQDITEEWIESDIDR